MLCRISCRAFASVASIRIVDAERERVIPPLVVERRATDALEKSIGGGVQYREHTVTIVERNRAVQWLLDPEQLRIVLGLRIFRCAYGQRFAYTFPGSPFDSQESPGKDP